MITNRLLKFGKFSFVVMAAVLALALVQTTVAFAGGVYGKCGKILDDGKDDGYGHYSISDVCLNNSNVVDSKALDPYDHGWVEISAQLHGNNAVSIKNRGNQADYEFGNDTQYNFSDKDGHYDIHRLTLLCEEIEDRYGIALIYDTNTYDLDYNGETFRVTGDIVFNKYDGAQPITINKWFEDDSDSQDWDYRFIWQMKKDEFNKLIPGYKNMKSAIKDGAVSICLKDLECRSYDQNDDHWIEHNISHLGLDKSSVEFEEESRQIIGRTNQFNDGRHYDFSDELGKTYDIYGLNLKAYSHVDKDQEKLCLTYHTDTPALDSSEDFKVKFIIFVDDSIYKCVTKEFSDERDSDGREDSATIWECDSDEFISEFGFSLVRGIANGRVVVKMLTLECDPC